MEIRSKFTKKRVIWGIVVVVVVLLVGGCIKSRSGASSGTLTENVKKQQLRRTVLATGQVVSATDLSLSFRTTGAVKAISVDEGAVVKAGDQLAMLDQKDVYASLTQARGSLAQASANYRKVLDGSSNEQITVAQRSVDAAQVSLDNSKKALESSKKQQAIAVSNSLKTLLNSGLAAEAAPGNVSSAAPTISGTYSSTEQGAYVIKQVGGSFSVSGLESLDNIPYNSTGSFTMPLGRRGLFFQFPTSLSSGQDQWTIQIPNTKSALYVGSYNAYQAALDSQSSSLVSSQSAVDSAQVALAQAQANLDLQRSGATSAELDAARAQVLSAQGQVQAAQAKVEDTIIRAPIAGTITKVDAKVGQQVAINQSAITLQDIGQLHVEANVSESNISPLKSQQPVEFTFDALGPDRKFKGTVTFVNPASVVVSGVVNYKVTFAVELTDSIKPGMTANVSVLVDQKDGVLTVPQRAVVTSGDKKVVRVVTDTKTKTFKEVPVTLGIEGDGGLVEVTSGLSEGEEIITYIKK